MPEQPRLRSPGSGSTLSAESTTALVNRTPRAGHTLTLTRCDDCQQVNRRARAVVDAHPGLAAQRGPELALENVEAVLVALGLLGQPEPGPDVAGSELALLLRHLDRVGSAMTWQGRLVAGRCTRYPFAHVRLGDRRRLREAAAWLLRERVSLTAPSGEGPASQVQGLGGRERASEALWTRC